MKTTLCLSFTDQGLSWWGITNIVTYVVLQFSIDSAFSQEDGIFSTKNWRVSGDEIDGLRWFLNCFVSSLPCLSSFISVFRSHSIHFSIYKKRIYFLPLQKWLSPLFEIWKKRLWSIWLYARNGMVLDLLNHVKKINHLIWN